MHKCLVTGGKGFIGRALCGALRKLGCDVQRIDLLEGRSDVRDRRAVDSVFFGYRPDTVFHLAAQTEVARSYADPATTYGTNVCGTLNVLESCRKYGVSSVLLASSDKAYGQDGVRSETDQLASEADFYSVTKRVADELARDYMRLWQLPVKVLRCANTYGPGQYNRTTLVAGTLHRIQQGEKPIVHQGAEGNVREWLYIDDAVQAYLSLVDAPSGAYNVGCGERYSVLEVVHKLLQMCGKAADWYDAVPHSTPQIRSQGLDCAKYRTLFPDWVPVTFDEGLQRTVRWFRSRAA
jgi:nucleoside-diphosphate-sugar epimerase